MKAPTGSPPLTGSLSRTRTSKWRGAVATTVPSENGGRAQSMVSPRTLTLRHSVKAKTREAPLMTSSTPGASMIRPFQRARGSSVPGLSGLPSERR